MAAVLNPTTFLATHDSRVAELFQSGWHLACTMFYHCIRYTIDRHEMAAFERYARKWMEGGIIRRCGGRPVGYFLPRAGFGGADNIAFALIGFESLADYEQYRHNLMNNPEARANLADAAKSRYILQEERSYFYRIDSPAEEASP